MTRTSRCACGRLAVTVHNEPVAVATCHCDFCQKRTGSVFGVAAYFDVDEELEVHGEVRVFNGLELDGVGDGTGRSVSYHFCPTCGSTLYWTIRGENPVMAMAVGNFVDPAFPAPVMELHTELRHLWVPAVPGAVPIGSPDGDVD
jgi:hypothetical protein